MKKIIILLIFAGVATNSFAQTSTYILEKGKAFEKYPFFKTALQISPEKKMPVFDVTSLLEEDNIATGAGRPFRFGKNFDVKLTLNDGKWIKTDSAEVWCLKIISPQAYSLNFIFSELTLPKGAELYIFNADGSMVFGPVADIQNLHRINYPTDLIRGDTAIILISLPMNIIGRPALTIQNVIHGYRNLFKSMGYEKSGNNCLLDVVCFPSWNDQSDGEVQIIQGEYVVSAVLLNNTAQDFKPFILTAWHNADNGFPPNGIADDGILQQSERNFVSIGCFVFASE